MTGTPNNSEWEWKFDPTTNTWYFIYRSYVSGYQMEMFREITCSHCGQKFWIEK